MDGTDLAALLAGGRGLDPGHALALAGQVAAALAPEHARGFAHGAVEPANVQLEGDRAWLSGAGRAPEDPAYAAPELRGGGEPTPRSDVYGLAAVVAAALPGHPPSRRDAVPGPVGEALARGLARDPRDRPASADELMRAVRAAARGSVPPVSANPTASASTALRTRLERGLVLAAMAVVAVNIWTGSPLLALWIGSRLQGTSGLSMGAVFAVIAVMGVTSFLLVKLLGVLGARHDRLIGLKPAARRQQPWLRSLSGERASEQRRRAHVSALDVVLVGTVLIAACAFEVWFFFFSGSSI
jgi:hypothetical protein